jgi:hypothetical protein
MSLPVEIADSCRSKELVIISVELVEKSEALEAEFVMPRSDDLRAAEIATRDDDDPT